MKSEALRNIAVHLDDSGATQSISMSHLDLIRKGGVDSLSILTNCQGSEFFFEQLKKVNQLKTMAVYVHLNIVEGRPISSEFEFSGIIDQENHFNLNHIKLFQLLYLTRKSTREQFLMCIKKEFAKQIERVIENLGVQGITGIDTHRHIHAHKKIHELLVELSKTYQIQIIRKTHERFFLGHPLDLLKASFYLGLARNLYLKLLSIRNPVDFTCGCAVTGIIYSGSMNFRSTIVGVSKNYKPSRSKCDHGNVLAIFHAGRATKDEVDTLPKGFQDWYLSENRLVEYETAEMINELRGKDD